MAGTLRITGGRLARRRIAVPPAADRGAVRPTSDKVREAVFSALGALIEGARVLDLFAGSGALGLEALSRGARHVTFVERDAKTARTIADNIAALDVTSAATLLRQDAPKFLAAAAPASFDVVFVDPPYADDIAQLGSALANVVAPGGRVVLERDRRSDPPALPGLSLERDRRYGDTRIFVLAANEAGSVSMSTAAIYPGSFDPLTMGHVDIVERGLRTFGRVVIAVANNPQKSHLFSIEERLALLQSCLGHHKGLEIDTFDGLIIEYARKKQVQVLLRGLRAVSDFEYEFQLAGMNRKLAPDVETVFMVTSEESFYLSSRLVREVASFGGNVKGMVPDPVFAALKKKYNK